METDKETLERLKRSREKVQQRPGVDTSGSRKRMDKKAFVKKIKELLPGSDLLTRHRQVYESGEIILHENQENRRLFVILEGAVQQSKAGKENTPIDLQGPGDFLGLLSFQTGERVFTTGRAATKVVVLRMGQGSLDRVEERYPEISKMIQGLIFSNLSERYRRVVTLHVEVAQLSRQLENERNTLQQTIRELEQTRNLLINQEKMATLGEMTAGLAHEINNPASALLRSVDYLTKMLPGLTEQAAALPDTGVVREFLEAGMNRPAGDPAAKRKKQKELAHSYPHLSRSIIRGMAELDDALLQKMQPYARDKNKPRTLEMLLESYQTGAFLNSVRLSTGRIEHLVKSLKSYSRSSGAEPEVIDIRQGIQETLMILGNRLKEIEVQKELPEIPPVKAYVGELNQVWTNIIINACDAMNDEGKLFISCGTSDDKQIYVRIADNGPGVPDSLKKKVFDSSFTTKTAGGEFGLGIGLAITRGVVQKHSGHIEVHDRKGGGAEFLIYLPAHRE
jgi:signal transduction histidine kinase